MLEIRNVLAATDLSAASDRVVRTAAELALRSDAVLHVIHTVELPLAMPEPVLGAGVGLDIALLEERRMQAGQGLQDQLARVITGGQQHAQEVVPGESAAAVIRRRAEELPADLIVIGPHREGRGAAGLLGTTAENVLRSAPAPVLVVRDAVSDPAGRVLAVVDPGEFSPAMIQAAIDWAGALSARGDAAPAAGVEVVYVQLDLVTGPMPFDRARVVRGPGRAPLGGVPAGTELAEVVLWGDSVADTLVAYAREARADLVVAGSHGRGAIRRALLGSTSSALARRAPCSVLLLPPALWRVP